MRLNECMKRNLVKTQLCFIWDISKIFINLIDYVLLFFVFMHIIFKSHLYVQLFYIYRQMNSKLGTDKIYLLYNSVLREKFIFQRSIISLKLETNINCICYFYQTS